MKENFQPISVKSPKNNILLFIIRCFFDLQVKTIASFLKITLSLLKGRVLDIGCGESPWRDYFTDNVVEYVGLDIEQSEHFKMTRNSDIVYYNGEVLPFDNCSFDHCMSLEVLEHVKNPTYFLTQIHRVLRKNGTLTLTIPWSARRHHIPHDYQRFTQEGLMCLLELAGFDDVKIMPRGNDIAVIANKLLVLTIRLFFIRKISDLLYCLTGILLTPFCGVFLIAAHISIFFGLGSNEDPLGYSVIARRKK